MKFFDFQFNKAFTQDDLITQDKYLAFASENTDWIQFAKTDSLFHSFEWRGNHVDLFYPKRTILLFSHSDIAFKQQFANMYGSNRIFAVNADCVHKNVYGLPHGLTNDCDDTVIHPILGNQQILCEVLQSEKNPKHLLYMNFSLNTDANRPMPIRKVLWNTFSNCPFVYKKECTEKNLNLVDRKQYLQDIYDSKFVLCPEGNGIDTVRLWEALYCRTIPIVQSNIAMRYFDRLPILWVNNWGECMNTNYLEEQYTRIMNTDWDLDLLKIGYWKDKMKQVYKETIE